MADIKLTVAGEEREYRGITSVQLNTADGGTAVFIDADSAVLYVAQPDKTDAEKAQARSNIGAAAASAIKVLEPKHTVLSATLVTGETTLTFTNEAISDNAMVYIYTNVWGVQPTDVVQSGATLTLTFEAQSADLIVKVEVR